jgi:hypothetical protein
LIFVLLEFKSAGFTAREKKSGAKRFKKFNHFFAHTSGAVRARCIHQAVSPIITATAIVAAIKLSSSGRWTFESDSFSKNFSKILIK